MIDRNPLHPSDYSKERRTVLDRPNLFSFSKGFSNGSSSRSLTARDPPRSLKAISSSANSTTIPGISQS